MTLFDAMTRLQLLIDRGADPDSSLYVLTYSQMDGDEQHELVCDIVKDEATGVTLVETC